MEGPDVEDDEEFDWQIDQEMPVEEKPVGALILVATS